MARKRVLLLVTDGTDKVEATTIVDILRRTKLHVVVAGVALKNPAYAECQHGMKIIPDVCFEQEWDKTMI
ncbi:hypothetical protein BC937DRAFT_94439 [Endogone sp. FLAS-F59071]|nr:hypothetical protein BC937DRAFT_94439 [Endogone sp. FLAS-F59071]|eukprot:RUS14038.1 hypothetical protein BC937DRAFT_94439 [Endogone sp. FLAS-F59071]